MLTSVVPAASPIARRWERVAVVAVVVVLVGLAALHSVNRARSEAAKELVAFAAHEALHLDRVVERYRATAGLSGSSAPQADMYEAWRAAGDDGARERLFVRLGQIADAGGFADVVLLDPSLQPLWSATGEGTSVGARVAEVWPGGAPAGAEAVLSFDDAASTVPSLAFAVALRTDAVDPPPVVVFLLPATTVLARDLEGVAIGPPGVRIGLFDAAGDGLRGVAAGGDPPHPVAWALPWSRTDAFAVRLARGSVAQGRAVAAVDERGVAVLAVGRAVDEVGWFVLVQRDRAAVWAGILPNVAMAVLLAGAAAAVGVAAWARMRRRQRASAAHRAGEAARLLQAVTDASPDAVIAKDLHGRYLLFSRAAEAMTGKRAAEVLGRDVRMLLPPAEAAVAMERDRTAMRERRVVTTEERLTTVMGERVFLTTRGPLRDAEGRVVGVFDISRDITDRAAADAALRVDRQRLADSLEELQRFNDVLVDRELAMVDLKRRLSAALAELGRPDPFDLEALGSGGVEDA